MSFPMASNLGLVFLDQEDQTLPNRHVTDLVFALVVVDRISLLPQQWRMEGERKKGFGKFVISWKNMFCLDQIFIVCL